MSNSPLRKSYFPPMASYNINHLGLSDPKRRSEKLAFVRQLLTSFPILALQELHAPSRTEAALFFFDHLDAKVF